MKKKQPGNTGFIKELNKPDCLPANREPFTWDEPVVRPENEVGQTMRRIREGRAVAKPKSNIEKEYKEIAQKRRGSK